MKLALVCRPRTSSMALMVSFSKKHNLTNLNEHYLYESVNLPIHADSYRSFMKIKNLPTPESQFQSNISEITKKVQVKDNFVIKILPRMLTVPKFKILKSERLSEIKKLVLFNLTDTMNFNMYNKIYLCDRELYTSCASWVYTTHTNSFYVTSNNVTQKVIKVTEADYDQLRFYLLENILYHKLVNYLNKNNLPTTDITNSTSEYIDDNISMIKTNRQFCNLINDYGDMCKFIDNYHQYCLDETKDWNFY